MLESLRTPFTQRYGIDLPIAQAGMAFASMTAALPAAVSAAGGIGSIANVGFFPPAMLRDIWGQARQLTDRPLSINLITCFVQQPIIDACVTLRPASVSFHWGAPDAAWVTALHEAGIAVWEQVGSVAQAVRAAKSDIDLIIAQGSEAGGHNFGELPLAALVPRVRDAIGDRLLLASGGIVDGAGLAAALRMGADGAWVGTRFVASVESDAHPTWKARLVQASGADTVRTHVFGRHHPEFNPMRVLRNRVVREWHYKVDRIPADNSSQPVIGSMNVFGQEQALHRFQNLAPMKTAEGDFEELPLLCGEGVGGIHDIAPAGELVARMADEARRALAGRGDV